MSFFKPFGGNRKLFQRNATSHSPAQASAQSDAPEGEAATSAPAENNTNTPAPPQPRADSPAPNFAVEAEKQRQASIQSEWTQAIDTLGIASRMMKAATEAHQQALTENAAVIAGVVRQIVERIVHGTLNADDDALMRVINAAAEALPSDVVRLRMNPRDIERVRHLLPEDMAETVVPDPSIEGGCVAETQRASVDASHEAALQAVDTMLEDWLSSEAE